MLAFNDMDFDSLFHREIILLYAFHFCQSWLLVNLQFVQISSVSQLVPINYALPYRVPHWSSGDCLGNKSEDYQNCSVLSCVL